jgi:hypothetical protein
LVSLLPKVILAVVGVGVALFLLTAALDSTATIEVTYDGSLLNIQNVGEAPVQINDVVVNDRADCAVLNVLPNGNLLKVGDSMILMPLCEAVRVKVTTATGSETYYLAR